MDIIVMQRVKNYKYQNEIIKFYTNYILFNCIYLFLTK